MIRFLKSKILHIVVFITGACTLVLEVLATRLLSPYFGNTIFTVSSVIGVVLAALSMGYFIGGILAERKPNTSKFFLIIFYAGLATFLLKILSATTLPSLGYSLPITTGPLISSILLFTLPSVLLGILSPYVVELVKKNNPKKSAGKVSGEIFFVSTLGSIAGTFLAGFYLIPNFGVSRIILFVGIILTLIGLAGYVKVKKKLINFRLYLLALISLIAASNSENIFIPGAVYSKDGIYEKISVIDANYKGKPARILLQDRSASSAVDPSDFTNLVFDYTKYIDLYKIFNDNPKKALFIGGGAYTLPNYLIKVEPEVKVDVVEIEPELYEIAKKYFWVKDTYRLNNYNEDGRRFLHDSSEKYDIIFSDVYSTIYSITAHLTTKEFLKLTKARLTSNGILIANIIGDLSRQGSSLTISEMHTLKSVYPNSYYFAVDSPKDIGTQNLIFIGVNSDKKIDFNEIQILYYGNGILSNLQGSNIDITRFNLLMHPVLTDEYAPIESITSSLIERSENNNTGFNGKESLGIINQLTSYGPRNVGSAGHFEVKKFIEAEAHVYSEELFIEEWQEDYGNDKRSLTNYIARVNLANNKRILLGTHYDGLPESPGANNSASGVAILMELLRVISISEDKPKIGIDIVFFDGEEGLLIDQKKAFGSEHFTKNMNKYYKEKPIGSIILDMVCDKNLNIFYEKNSLDSAKDQTEKYFAIASEMYPDNFHKNTRFSMVDDHTALNKAGIPSSLLIDFDYPYYGTAKDTPDKCSAESLDKVGKSLLKYIYSL